MSKTLKADGNTGKVAIFSGSSDVFNNPFIDLSRVHFHSDLQYLNNLQSLSTYVTLPAVPINTADSFRTYTLFSNINLVNSFLSIRIDNTPIFGTSMSIYPMWNKPVSGGTNSKRYIGFTWTRNSSSSNINLIEYYSNPSQNTILSQQSFTVNVNVIKLV